MTLQRLRLDGKVAIITGGARGVGRGVAQALAEAGASVLLTARTQADLDATVAEFTAAGAKAVGIAADVMSDADNKRVIEAAVDTFGGIDILVNNAGGAHPVPFMDVTTEKFVRDLHFNVVSAFQLTQLAVPYLKAKGAGSVVNISSRSAQVGGKGFLTYSVAKTALERLSHMMAQELAPDIRVNTISLGTIMTDALQGYLDSSPEAREGIQTNIPLQRIGTTGDIGLAALFLCAQEGYATGTVIRVDGGITRSMA